MKCYQAAGLIVGIHGSPSPVLNAIHNFFCLCPPTKRHPYLHIIGKSCDERHIEDELPDWMSDSLTQAPHSAEPFYFHGRTGPAVILKNGNSISCAWLAGEMKYLNFVGSCRKGLKTALVVQPVIVPLLREIFMQNRQILLHSAAVRCADQTGVLIAAPGYGGKTTTTMALMRLGARLLGDDLIIIQPTVTGVHALGVPEPLNLTEQTLAYFNECRHIVRSRPEDRADRKQAISPADIFGPDCLIAESDLHVAYFVRISEAGPEVLRLSAVQAMQQFAAAHMFARNQGINACSTARLLEIVARLKVYELRTGSDPEQLGHWLMTHLSVHAER